MIFMYDTYITLHNSPENMLQFKYFPCDCLSALLRYIHFRNIRNYLCITDYY